MKLKLTGVIGHQGLVMKVNLRDDDGNVVKSYELDRFAVPTPLVVIDGSTDIMYALRESGNAYDYYAIPYHILGTQSEAMIDESGKMYWSRKAEVNAQ
jgi:hypothetical protein